jgi:hypothetical protein
LRLFAGRSGDEDSEPRLCDGTVVTVVQPVDLWNRHDLPGISTSKQKKNEHDSSVNRVPVMFVTASESDWRDALN